MISTYWRDYHMVTVIFVSLSLSHTQTHTHTHTQSITHLTENKCIIIFIILLLLLLFWILDQFHMSRFHPYIKLASGCYWCCVSDVKPMQKNSVLVGFMLVRPGQLKHIWQTNKPKRYVPIAKRRAGNVYFLVLRCRRPKIANKYLVDVDRLLSNTVLR